MKEVYEFFGLEIDKIQEISKDYYVDANNNDIVGVLKFQLIYSDEVQAWSKYKALESRIAKVEKIERATVKLNSVTENGPLLTVEVVIRAPNEKVR